MIEIINTKWTKGKRKMEYLHLNIKFEGKVFYFNIKNIKDVFKISLDFKNNRFNVFIWLLKVYKFNKKECRKVIRRNRKMKRILGKR